MNVKNIKKDENDYKLKELNCHVISLHESICSFNNSWLRAINDASRFFKIFSPSFTFIARSLFLTQSNICDGALVNSLVNSLKSLGIFSKKASL